MPFIEWSAELSVGNRKIDEEHKSLVLLVNQLHEAMMSGKGKDIMGKIFQDLLQYTVSHFRTEEILMDENSYPGRDIHKSEHQELVRQVVDLEAKFKAGSILISVETLNFLKKWLASHIVGTDKKLGRFLSEKGMP